MFLKKTIITFGKYDLGQAVSCVCVSVQHKLVKSTQTQSLSFSLRYSGRYLSLAQSASALYLLSAELSPLSDQVEPKLLRHVNVNTKLFTFFSVI